jgi:hypothetical protein
LRVVFTLPEGFIVTRDAFRFENWTRESSWIVASGTACLEELFGKEIAPIVIARPTMYFET